MIGQTEILANIEAHLEEKSVQNYLFSGEPGTGKTTVSYAVAEILTEGNTDNLKIVNASLFGRQNFLKDEIIPFCKSSTLGGGKKVIVLDEFDHASPAMQASFRRVMEDYSAHGNCVFILTCNYPRKVLPAIQSRCAKFSFKKVSVPDLVERGKFILSKEGIEFTDDDLMKIAEESDGKPRDFIQLIQQGSIKGSLVVPKAIEFRSFVGKMLRFVFKKEYRNIDEAVKAYYDIEKNYTSESREMLIIIHDLVLKNGNMLPEMKGKILRTVAETDYRLSVDTEPNIQMIGMLVQFYFIATPYLSQQQPVQPFVDEAASADSKG